MIDVQGTIKDCKVQLHHNNVNYIYDRMHENDVPQQHYYMYLQFLTNYNLNERG